MHTALSECTQSNRLWYVCSCQGQETAVQTREHCIEQISNDHSRAPIRNNLFQDLLNELIHDGILFPQFAVVFLFFCPLAMTFSIADLADFIAFFHIIWSCKYLVEIKKKASSLKKRIIQVSNNVQQKIMSGVFIWTAHQSSGAIYWLEVKSQAWLGKRLKRDTEWAFFIHSISFDHKLESSERRTSCERLWKYVAGNGQRVRMCLWQKVSVSVL